MKSLSFLLTFSFLLSACSSEPIEPVEQPDEFETEDSFTTIYIELEGASEEESIGCGDGLDPLENYIHESLSEEQKVRVALEALFEDKEQINPKLNHYNALYQSELTVDSVLWTPEIVTVALSGTLISGGTCDDPRIETQIMETIKANLSSDAIISVSINGDDLANYFDQSGL